MDKKTYETQKRYAKKNPMKVWAISTLCRHRQKYKVDITIEELLEIARRTKHCIYCGIELIWSRGTGRNPDGPSLDRRDAENFLNKNNVQVICCRCNARKSSASHENILKYGL